MYKIYDFRTRKDRKDIKLMKFVMTTLYSSESRLPDNLNESEEKILSLINRKIETNTFLLSLIYYKRLIDKSDPYWSWVGVLILSDGYLNDISYNNNAWKGVLNTTKQKIVELKKKILVDLDYSLFCKREDYINIKNSFEEYIIDSFIEKYL
jgi:hypothetical protein